MPDSSAPTFVIRTIAFLAIVCSLVAVLQIFAVPSEALWPVGMVAKELWPWMLLVNLVGLILAWRYRQRTATLFAVGLVVCLVPLVQFMNLRRNLSRQWTTLDYPADAIRFPTVAGTFKPSRSAPRVDPEILPLNIHLYRTPTDGALHPVMAYIHGGSWQFGSPSEDGWFTSQFAAKGWVVFSLDYRLAPGAQYPAQIDDVRAALAWINENARAYGGDPSAIALVGRSAGGHLAMLAAYTNESLPIKSVVSYYAPSDMLAFYADPPRPDPIHIQQKVETFLGGNPSARFEAYQDASPITYLRRGLPPTLQIHGSRDNVVETRFPRDFHLKLLNTGNASLLAEIPWSDHSFDFVNFGPGNQISMAYLEAFLNHTMAANPGGAVSPVGPRP